MRGLSPRASAYISAVLASGAVALAWSVLAPPSPTVEIWLAFATLTAGAAVSQLFPVVTPRNQSYELSPVFVFAGILLLPPTMISAMVVLAYVPQWFYRKRPWHIRAFNVAIFLVQAFAARAVYLGVTEGAPASLGGLETLIGAVLAAGTFAFINHLLLAAVLYLARGHSWRETRLFEPEYFLTDTALSSTGIVLASVWQVNPWLTGAVAGLLLLVHRALNTPNLEEQARTDGKTGLYNSKHFAQTVHEEFRRAARFDRPVALIMADLDLLRNINNSYGHLAGDVVLKGVAEIIKTSLREYDVAARFGGEEFSILLPETDAAQAVIVAERMRRRVEATCFTVSTSAEPIRTTLSLGVAAFPAHGAAPQEVIHQADLAVYYAKLRGRNRTWTASPESRTLAAPIAVNRQIGKTLEKNEVIPSAAPENPASAHRLIHFPVALANPGSDDRPPPATQLPG